MLQNASGLLLLSALLLPCGASAQVICRLGSSASSYNAYQDQRPTADAMELARQVSAALEPLCRPNCPVLVVFRNATAPNVILLADSGRAKMAYAPQFFTTVYDNYGDGAIIAIMAHMLGHAIDAIAPAAWMKRGWTPELRADAWAGCSLAHADLSSIGLRDALTAVSMYPSDSHPDWPGRIPALRLGYVHCGGDGMRFDAQAGKVKVNGRPAGSGR
jgi:hypothetical protein